MDIDNTVLFLTVLGTAIMAGGLWALLKPRDREDIDADNFKPRSIEELPHYRFIGGWGGGISHHSDRPREGPKGLWENEVEYYEDAMRRRLERAKKEEAKRSP